MDEGIKAYLDRMQQVRKLSATGLEGISSADEYMETLLGNFRRIGELGRENRQWLKEVVEPILTSDEPLTDEQFAFLNEMRDQLADATYVTQVDLYMAALMYERLDTGYDLSDDLYALIMHYDNGVDLYYMAGQFLARFFTAPHLQNRMIEMGLERFARFKEYLDPEKFAKLDGRSKRRVIVAAQYCPMMYTHNLGADDEEINAANMKQVAALEEAFRYITDPFYNAPDVGQDPVMYMYAILSSFAVIPPRALDDDTVRKLLAYSVMERAVYNSSSDERKAIIESDTTPPVLDAYIVNFKMTLGEVTWDEYRDTILECYRRSIDEFTIDDDRQLSNAVDIGMLYIERMYNRGETDERDREFLKEFYPFVVSGMFHVEIDDFIMILVCSIVQMMYFFIDVPGGMGFEELGLKCFAAVHPPTYIHCRMVARISRCLASHLIESDPGMFTGICGCDTPEDVTAHADEILDYTYHAALCHDFGKISIMDTIYIYGRALLDSEFDMLKQHPRMGAELLRKHEDTREYADVALGHHHWYDDSRGYPDDFTTSDSKYKTIIDIVCVADCMDAATDSVGRSYNKGKTYDEFEQEVAETAGTRYAPYMPALLARPEVRADMVKLLSEARREEYRNTYYLVKEMQQEKDS